MNSSQQPNDAQFSAPDHAAGQVERSVRQCASNAGSRTEFLKRFAVVLSDSFNVAIIAVESYELASPMMLVRDDVTARHVDRDAISELLASASFLPSAGDVRLKTPANDGRDHTRGLRVELTKSPYASAMLLIYNVEAIPSASDQVLDLKRLSEYLRIAREIIDGLPTTEIENQLTVAQAETDTANSVATALRNRQSLCLFHRDLDVEATAYRIASESRRLLQCDRATVLIRRGKKYRVRAISGVSVVDRRSNSVKAIEELSTRAAVIARPLMLPSEEPLPPQLQNPLDRYLDESSVMKALLLPLHAPERDGKDDFEIDAVNPFDGQGEILGMLCLEYFEGDSPPGVGPGMTLVASEAVLALQNSMEHERVFGLRTRKAIGGATRQGAFPYVMLGIALLAAFFIVSGFIQTEHYVTASGTVEPSEQRQVFSGVDGIVKKILVTDGENVNEGQPLFELENAELESQSETISGEIMTASKRLSAIDAIRLNPETDANQSGRLAMEQRRLKSELENLKAQQQLIQKLRDELTITSPINGTIVGWQLRRRFSNRPITRGNVLLNVVNHTGPWQLRLRIPDRDAGPVLRAMRGSKRLLTRFAVATDPEASFLADLESISTAARLNQSGQHVLDANAKVWLGPPSEYQRDEPNDGNAQQASTMPTLNLQRGEVDEFNPEHSQIGADVTARIACGKRSVMRSWFSDVFDFADRNIFFYFR